MSTRVTAQATMSASCQQRVREALDLRFGAALDLGALGEALAGARIELSALQSLVRTDSISATLSKLAPVPLERSRVLLAAPSPGADLRAIAASAQDELKQAVAAASAAITASTRDITAKAFAEAGQELGYTVSVCRGPLATGVEMRRAHEVMLLRVNDGGTVESDQAGLTDGTCADRHHELELAVVRRGITLTGKEKQLHGSAKGGHLLKVASSRRDSSLARAAALTAGQPTAQAPSSRRRASARTDEVLRQRRRTGGAA